MNADEKFVRLFRELAEKNCVVRSWEILVLDQNGGEVFIEPADRGKSLSPKLVRVQMPLTTIIYDPNAEGGIFAQVRHTAENVVRRMFSGRKLIVRIDESGGLITNRMICLGSIPFRFDVEGGPIQGFELFPGNACWPFFTPDPKDREAMSKAIHEYYLSKPTPCSGGTCGRGGGMSG